MQAIPNIEALRGRKGTPNATINVLGTDTAFDGGFSVFGWDNTSEEIEVIGSIVKVNNVAKGRWKALLKKARTPYEYGGKGNGTANDTAAIQACIDANKYVYIPKGDWLTGTLKIPSNRFIMGEGLDTVLKANADNTHILTVYDTPLLKTKNVRISNLKLDGGGQVGDVNTAGFKAAYGIYVSNAEHVFIEGVFIDKCGVMNPVNPILDNGFGGYGMLIEARYGEIKDVHVKNCVVTNIAGGGYYMGDGIYIAGYNADLSIIPKQISVENCYVENCGRHCYTVAGEGAWSVCKNVTFRGIYGKNAALCGIDFEEGENCLLEDFHFEGCGNYTGYFNPLLVPEYGVGYRLLSGVTTGNYSNHNTIRNGKISGCYYGLNWGAGTNNLWENITIDNSTIADAARGLAQFGDRNTLRNVKLLTTGKTVDAFYNGNANANLLIDRCYFASIVNLSGLKNSTFKACAFTQKVTFGGQYEIKNLRFIECIFTGDRGLNLELLNLFTDDILVKNCQFIGNTQYGIFLKYQSVTRLKVEGCIFKDITGTAIRHDNNSSQKGIEYINNNTFINCTTGIFLYQGGKFGAVKGNRFSGITGWCFDTDVISEVNGFYGFIVRENIADETCANGIRINTGGIGTWDYCIVRDNIVNAVTLTPYSFTTGNPNGYYKTKDIPLVINRQTGDYTLSLLDVDALVEMDKATAVSVTIPLLSSMYQPFAIGHTILVAQMGAGQVTLVLAGGVTVIDTTTGLKTAKQGAVISLIMRANNVWYHTGNLTT